MTISTLFFSFIGILAASFLFALYNMMAAVKRINSFSSIQNSMVLHIICIAGFSIGGFGALITGIIWILPSIQHFLNKN